MNKIAFLITTRNRSESCQKLAYQLEEHGDIYIVDDASDQDYTWASQFHYQRRTTHGGKEKYWQTVNALWQMVLPHADDYAFFIMLPDDFIPEPNFLKKSLRAWRSIPDARKICLNLYVDRGRIDKTCWTGIAPTVFPEGRLTQWVDMCFMCEVEFFEALQWKVPHIDYDWADNPEMSSRVGAEISKYLANKGYKLWQTHTTMFVPAEAAKQSQLNPHRNTTPEGTAIHDTVPGRITAQIASLPERVEMLRKTVASLRPQVDHIFVALNNYPDTPDFLAPGEYVHLDNTTGDAAKFFDVENLQGYLLTCDDDLVYPANYAEFMIYHLHKYNAITTLHGKGYPRPFTHFLNRKTDVRCLQDYPYDVRIDTPGTGVMCLHSGLIKLNYTDFKTRNMADVWITRFAQEQKVPIVAIAHSGNYLQYLGPEYTIYEEEQKKGFETQNRLLAETLNQ